jgi:hypothetical protein
MWKLHELGATCQLMLTSVLGSSILKGTQQDQQQQQLRTVKDFPNWDALMADSGNHQESFACFLKTSCVLLANEHKMNSSSNEIFNTLQRTNSENSKQIFLFWELRGHSPNFHIHVSVRDLFNPTIDLPILLQEICGPILGIYKSLTDT